MKSSEKLESDLLRPSFAACHAPSLNTSKVPKRTKGSSLPSMRSLRRLRNVGVSMAFGRVVSPGPATIRPTPLL